MGMHKSVKESSAPGFYGTDCPHILTYVPGEINTFGALLTNRALTVCASAKVLLYHGAVVLYALLLMLVFGQDIFFPDGRPSCSPAEASNVNKRMCRLEDVLLSAKAEFRFLVSSAPSSMRGSLDFWRYGTK